MGNITNKKAYSLSDFINACKNKREYVLIDNNALKSASESPLRITNNRQIMDFISNHKESEFEYVNTKIYRKGFCNEHPNVDSYLVHLKFWDLYIAFCFVRNISKWYIKSFHSDRIGETLTIGEFLNLGRL